MRNSFRNECPLSCESGNPACYPAGAMGVFWAPTSPPASRLFLCCLPSLLLALSATAAAQETSSLKTLQEQAEAGNAASQFELAMLYLEQGKPLRLTET